MRLADDLRGDASALLHLQRREHGLRVSSHRHLDRLDHRRERLLELHAPRVRRAPRLVQRVHLRAPQRLLQTVGQMAIDLAPDNQGMHADPAIKIGRQPNYGQVGLGVADHFDQR